jgi:cell division control protein 45
LQKEVQKFNRDDVSGTQEVVLDSDTTIKYVDDYRFMLYRHWTLYDSMYHSPYVATRLGIWKETGRKKLQTMLARLGFAFIYLFISFIL